MKGIRRLSDLCVSAGSKRICQERDFVRREEYGTGRERLVGPEVRALARVKLGVSCRWASGRPHLLGGSGWLSRALRQDTPVKNVQNKVSDVNDVMGAYALKRGYEYLVTVCARKWYGCYCLNRGPAMK